MEYKKTKHFVYACTYHIIWCSKYRKRLFIGDVDAKLKEILFSMADELGFSILELEVMPDHVHLLAEIKPTCCVYEIVKKLKGRSSRILREEFPSLKKLPSLWTGSCFISTVGGAPLSVIKKYIENQKYS